MTPNREILPNPVYGFLVDMGRWRGVASIDKVLRNEVGPEWHIKFIRPLDEKGRRFLVEADYVEPQRPQVVATELRSYTVAPDGEVTPPPRKEPVIGKDVFSKTQMRKVQTQLEAEHIANRNLAEELNNERAKNSELLAELEKLSANQAKPPKFAKEQKPGETQFQMLKNCVLQRLATLERFDCKNIKLCAEACGIADRGLEPNKFVRGIVTGGLRSKIIEPAGERNGEKCYRLTNEGKNYLEEVRSENQ